MIWRQLVATALAALVAGSPAYADPAAPPEIVQLIADWYSELGKVEKGRPWLLVAPGFIDSTPHYDYADTGSAALGRPIYTSLAARAAKFSHRITRVRLDSSFARVEVDERGYFCAWSIPQTYETSASTTFVLERQEADGRWLILAHQSGGYGIPPGQETSPMPELCQGDPPPGALLLIN